MSEVKCKNCGIVRGSHKANTFHCPLGKKNRRIGYTGYSKDKTFQVDGAPNLLNAQRLRENLGDPGSNWPKGFKAAGPLPKAPPITGPGRNSRSKVLTDKELKRLNKGIGMVWKIRDKWMDYKAGNGQHLNLDEQIEKLTAAIHALLGFE